MTPVFKKYDSDFHFNRIHLVLLVQTVLFNIGNIGLLSTTRRYQFFSNYILFKQFRAWSV